MYSKVAKFDGIIIETTGLADPAPVAQTFLIDEEIQKLYSLDAIVTVVDAKHLEMRLDDEKPEGVENEAEEQVRIVLIIFFFFLGKTNFFSLFPFSTFTSLLSYLFSHTSSLIFLFLSLHLQTLFC
jgi:hypothetical protein